MIELTPERILMRKAERFAEKAHLGQKYGEHDYIYHLRGVVRLVEARMKGDPMLSTYVAVAWLHDVLEDTKTTFKELVDAFGLAIATAVLAITKNDELSYEAYMVNCCENAIAHIVKICDTLFNLNESFNTLNKKGMYKYPTQLAILVAGVWAGELVYYKEARYDTSKE